MHGIPPEGGGETEAAAQGGDGGAGEAGRQFRAGEANVEQGERPGHQISETAPDQLPADAQEEPGPGAGPEGAHSGTGEPDRAWRGR